MFKHPFISVALIMLLEAIVTIATHIKEMLLDHLNGGGISQSA